MPGFALDELADVFRALQGAGWDAVLVGGQAVNVWACHYERDEAGWHALRPYTSQDVDYFGGLSEARLAMKVLNAKGTLNTNFDPGPNAGVLQVRLADGREVIVDILTGVYGVSAAEVERTAVVWSGTGALAGLTLRVMHPLLLLEAKLASWRGLPQAGRQDAKHVRILILVNRQWLGDQLGQPRAVFRVIERLAACAAGPDALHAFARGLNVMEILPLDEMRAKESFQIFFQNRFPQLQAIITGKRARFLEALGDSS